MTRQACINGLLVRDAEDRDAQDVFGLGSLCFAEFPGCFIDPHDDLADLVQPASRLGAQARFWVVEDQSGRIGACAGIDWRDGMAEMHRLYVRPDMRRGGLARKLIAMAETVARENGAQRIEAWSDIRFEGAHRLYVSCEFSQTEQTRTLGDISDSHEYHFAKVFER